MATAATLQRCNRWTTLESILSKMLRTRNGLCTKCVNDFRTLHDKEGWQSGSLRISFNFHVTVPHLIYPYIASRCPIRSVYKNFVREKKSLPKSLFNSHLFLPSLWSLNTTTTTRQYHSNSKFSLSNQSFALYVQGLVGEFNSLTSERTLQDSPSGDPHRETLRLQFLKSVVGVIERLQGKHGEIQELKSMLNEEEDKEMSGLMQKELEDLEQQIEEIEDELVDCLVGEEVADHNDIILEVTAGVGGQEAMLFCAEIFNMYCNYATFKGWGLGVITEDANELGGARKASVEIGGENVYKHLKYEAGVHRVQRVPKTEKQGRMHTSTVTVAILPQPREIDIHIDSKDLKIETMKGSGPGGQSVNTTDSAVRITHLPTGTVAECKQERSQIKNRVIAMKSLVSKMYRARVEDQELERRTTRKMQTGTRGRSEKIRTYNFQQDRISDHRLKENWSNMQGFMLGGETLDQLIASVEQQHKIQTLESMLAEFEWELAAKTSRKK